MIRFLVEYKYKFIIILVSIIISVFLVWIFGHKKDDDFKKYRNEAILDYGNNYYLKVEYPKFNNKKLNQKISNMVNNEIDNFKESTKRLSVATEYDYELNIQYTITKTDRLYSIHFVVYKFLGGAHYERKDLIYYYDFIDNKEVSWDSLFIDKNISLNELSSLTSTILKREYREYIYLDKYIFEEGIKPIKNNFKYIMFSEDYVDIIFPPYQVGPWSSGEILVKLGYGDINNILIDKYKGEDDPERNNPITSYKRKTRDIEELRGKKLLAITFDDGPAPSTTLKLLDGLRERDAKVTFFVLGNRVRQFPEIIKKAYDEGHTIGSHTYSHKNLKNLNDNELKIEITRANDEIEKAIGKSPTILRPPYGEYNKHVIDISGMPFILWNIDPQDWKYKDTERVYDHIINSAKDGNIILLHDIYDTSVEAALMAIDTLIEQGYAIVSLEELEKLGKIDLKNNQAYFRIK